MKLLGILIKNYWHFVWFNELYSWGLRLYFTLFRCKIDGGVRAAWSNLEETSFLGALLLCCHVVTTIISTKYPSDCKFCNQWLRLSFPFEWLELWPCDSYASNCEYEVDGVPWTLVNDWTTRTRENSKNRENLHSFVPLLHGRCRERIHVICFASSLLVTVNLWFPTALSSLSTQSHTHTHTSSVELGCCYCFFFSISK